MDHSISITITHVLEHLYCPRFTYFEHVLAIPERQERRWKVQKGRQVHLERQKALLRPTMIQYIGGTSGFLLCGNAGAG